MRLGRIEWELVPLPYTQVNLSYVGIFLMTMTTERVEIWSQADPNIPWNVF